MLLFHFQSHESIGSHVTDGYLEALDARAAVEFMRQPGMEKVGIIGFSLAAAAAGPADWKDRRQPDAMVLEAPTPMIQQAMADSIRLRLGDWGGWRHPYFNLQLEPAAGNSPRHLCGRSIASPRSRRRPCSSPARKIVIRP